MYERPRRLCFAVSTALCLHVLGSLKFEPSTGSQKIRTRKCADFYFLPLHYSLFTNSACTDFLESARLE